MKIIIRSLVVTLALTGAIATTYVSSASAKTTVTAAKTSAYPAPTCDPSDPGDCGL